MFVLQAQIQLQTLAPAHALPPTSSTGTSTGAGASHKSSTANSQANKTGNGNTTAPPQSSVKLYGQVNDLMSACYNAGVEITSTTLPTPIKKVRMGSAAFYSGLQDKDVIIKGTLENNRLQITFKRGTATYAVNLPTEAGATPSQVVLPSGASTNRLSSSAEQQQFKLAAMKDPAWKKLKNYDIVILIDQSTSMNDVVDANGTTKWDWCANQLTSFSSQALIATGRRFTIITFNGEYRMSRDCSPEDVHQTFLRNRPGGPTDLATPLDFVLKDYMGGSRINPLLVVVLTDGMPARPDLIERLIVDTTHRMTSPEQIKLVFFEIGNDSDGAAVLRLFDFGLISEGAKFDIVDANSFSRLQEVGLKLALYDTFNQNFQTRLKMSPTASLKDELEAVRQQIRQARARNAQNPAER
jgi:hypothetical protein